VSFGLIAGGILGSWADLFDSDQDREPERVIVPVDHGRNIQHHEL
jgi:hypothetical protein